MIYPISGHTRKIILVLYLIQIPLPHFILICSKKLKNYSKLTSGKLTQLLKIAIEIVDLPMNNGDFPQLCKRLPEGIHPKFFLKAVPYHLSYCIVVGCGRLPNCMPMIQPCFILRSIMPNLRLKTYISYPKTYAHIWLVIQYNICNVNVYIYTYISYQYISQLYSITITRIHFPDTYIILYNPIIYP